MRRVWKRRRMEENLAGYLFILPNLLGVLCFVLVPIAFSMILVFTEWDYLKGLKGLEWIGLGNFAHMAEDDWFAKSLTNTVVFTAVTVPAAMVVGLIVAVLLNQYVYLKQLIRTLFFLPYVSSVVAVGIVWSVMYNAKEGPINQWLRSVGIGDPPGWLASPHWALPAIMIMTVWMYIGYTMIIYLAGLQGIPRDLYEAAGMDGAGKLRQLLQITVPMLRPTSFLIAVTLVIASFQVFGAVAVMTQGGPMNATLVLSYHIYLMAFQYNKMGYAAAISWVLFVIIFIVTLLQWQSQKKSQHIM